MSETSGTGSLGRAGWFAAGIGAALAATAAVAGYAAERSGPMWQSQGGFARWHGRAAGAEGAARWCGGAREWRTEELLGLVERQLELTPAQTPAWEELGGALRAATARLAAACTPGPDDAPGRLRQAETLLEAGLETLRELRPALERFHATLDETQRRTLDDLMVRRHGRH
jgi:hypothetical protein